MESDAQLQSLTAGLNILTDHLTSQDPNAHASVVICLASNHTVSKVLDTTPHIDQQISIAHTEQLDNILHFHPNSTIHLLWLPKAIPFIGFRRAKQLAMEAIWTADLKEVDEPYSINELKCKMKVAAVKEWMQQWHQAPHESLIYCTALTELPNGRVHPSFNITRTKVANSHFPNPAASQDADNQVKAKFSCSTYSTFYCLTTGHAFIGSFTQCFFPHHTPKQVACQCSEPVQMVEHMLLHCPQYTPLHQRHLTANGCLHGISCLFMQQKLIKGLLCFLEETGACYRLCTIWELG